MRVAIDRAGRVHSVAGSPRHDLAVASVEPSLSGAEALARLQQNVGVERSLPVTSGPSGARHTTNFKGGDFARLVLFGAADGAKLAWHVTYRATSTAFYDAVVDAASGAILYRQNLVKAAANAEVYPNHPGAARPRRSTSRTSACRPARPSSTATGRAQWADVDDDNVADAGGGDAAERRHRLRLSVHARSRRARLPGAEPCAWDPADRDSWTDEPRPERRPGLLPRLPLPRPPRR